MLPEGHSLSTIPHKNRCLWLLRLFRSDPITNNVLDKSRNVRPPTSVTPIGLHCGTCSGFPSLCLYLRALHLFTSSLFLTQDANKGRKATLHTRASCCSFHSTSPSTTVMSSYAHLLGRIPNTTEYCLVEPSGRRRRRDPSPEVLLPSPLPLLFIIGSDRHVCLVLARVARGDEVAVGQAFREQPPTSSRGSPKPHRGERSTPALP